MRGTLHAGLGAALTAWVGPELRLENFADRHWVAYWSKISGTAIVTAALAGLAGAVVVNSHQTVLATGVMVALALIPAMAIFGIGLVIGDPTLAFRGLARWGVDAACVMAASSIVFAIKRGIARRRAER